MRVFRRDKAYHFLHLSGALRRFTHCVCFIPSSEFRRSVGVAASGGHGVGASGYAVRGFFTRAAAQDTGVTQLECTQTQHSRACMLHAYILHATVDT